ncbi:MAG: hypothetical protein AAGB29_02650 [Planctomycetota bacterium]
MHEVLERINQNCWTLTNLKEDAEMGAIIGTDTFDEIYEMVGAENELRRGEFTLNLIRRKNVNVFGIEVEGFVEALPSGSEVRLRARVRSIPQLVCHIWLGVFIFIVVYHSAWRDPVGLLSLASLGVLPVGLCHVTCGYEWRKTVSLVRQYVAD